MDGFLTQLKSLGKLPAAWKGDADSAYNAYSTKKQLQVAQNKKNKQWGNRAVPASYKKGGKVKKTGLAKVHKGEVVLTKKQAKKFKKMKGRSKKGTLL